ncbi:hypothetical protein Y032_0625g798 [Ancylostoma ceylanicum]|uniref:Uncharacterized protein n=1 Tax=Ancylostoma ceylanicum TaxID=53326 RepID=A0A016WKM8_9BILA|nr:hypothetical protein Y032_0625g798 [Ancylostoma ceylanicum]
MVGIIARAAGILPEKYSTYGRLHFRNVLIVGGPISASDRTQSIRIQNEVATATAMLGATLLEEYIHSLGFQNDQNLKHESFRGCYL